MTEIENQLLFDEGITAKGKPMVEQLMNLDLKRAYEQSIRWAREHKPFTVEMLKNLSALVMRNTGSHYSTLMGEFDSSKGDLRLVGVTAGAGGRSYMDYRKVPMKLEEDIAIADIKVKMEGDNKMEKAEKEVDQKGGPETRNAILQLIASNGNITSREIANTLKINRSAISKHLKKMQEDHIIRREGSQKSGRWVIIS